MKRFGLLLVLALLAGSMIQPFRVQAGSITVTPTTAVAGDYITATFGGPCSWIGLFAVGALDANPLGWMQCPNAVGGINGTGGTYTVRPSAVGQYNFRLFADWAGNQRIAVSSTVTITASPNNITGSLSASPITVAPLGAIQVNYTISRRDAGQWIGMYYVGNNEQTYITYINLTGTNLSGTIRFTAPGGNGTVFFRLFADTGYRSIATSNRVTVGTGKLCRSATATQRFALTTSLGFAGITPNPIQFSGARLAFAQFKVTWCWQNGQVTEVSRSDYQPAAVGEAALVGMKITDPVKSVAPTTSAKQSYRMIGDSNLRWEFELAAGASRQIMTQADGTTTGITAGLSGNVKINTQLGTLHGEVVMDNNGNVTCSGTASAPCVIDYLSAITGT